MKNTTVLDTNVILRYLLNDHPTAKQKQWESFSFDKDLKKFKK